jgi:hypothetical protein
MATPGAGFEVQRDLNLRLDRLAPDISLELTNRTDLLSGAELVGSLLTGTPAATLLPRKTSALAPVATVLEGEGGATEVVPGQGSAEEDVPGFVVGLDDMLHRQRPLPVDRLQGFQGPIPGTHSGNRLSEEHVARFVIGLNAALHRPLPAPRPGAGEDGPDGELSEEPTSSPDVVFQQCSFPLIRDASEGLTGATDGGRLFPMSGLVAVLLAGVILGSPAADDPGGWGCEDLAR